jgi:hypothetical protein
VLWRHQEIDLKISRGGKKFRRELAIGLIVVWQWADRGILFFLCVSVSDQRIIQCRGRKSGR